VAELNGNNFRYEIENMSNRGTRGPDRFTGVVDDRNPLPEKIVYMHYLIDAHGKPIDSSSRHEFGSFSTGEGMASGGMSRANEIAAMRYEVAVGLKIKTVTVTLKNVELPKLSTAQNALPTEDPNLTPFMRAKLSVVREIERQRDRAPQNGWSDDKEKAVRDLWKSFENDWNAGMPNQLVATKVMDVVPDAKSYLEYVGTYLINPDRAVDQAASKPAPLKTTIRVDGQNHLTLEIENGKSAPLIAKNGALFGVFSPWFFPSDAMDSKSLPRLAGFWVIRHGGKTTMYMDTGYGPVTYEMEKQL